MQKNLESILGYYSILTSFLTTLLTSFQKNEYRFKYRQLQFGRYFAFV